MADSTVHCTRIHLCDERIDEEFCKEVANRVIDDWNSFAEKQGNSSDRFIDIAIAFTKWPEKFAYVKMTTSPTLPFKNAREHFFTTLCEVATEHGFTYKEYSLY